MPKIQVENQKDFMMQRTCCLCASTVKEFERKNWKLPIIGSREIAFGTCQNCGMVIQSEALSIGETNTYYRELATYINPGRRGKPSAEKIRGLGRTCQLVPDIMRKIPSSVFQVGCSDGYTLSRFKELGVAEVTGIDLSIASCEMAKAQYGLNVILGDIEAHDFCGQTYELIVLTHVLEHLYDPISVLKKCSEIQEENGWALIEVPLLEAGERFPPGIFSLEHLNYFTENTILNLIERCGYQAEVVMKDFEISKYPIITLFCKKAKNAASVDDDFNYIPNNIIRNYLAKEHESWKGAEQHIHDFVEKGARVYVYGAGLHTTQLLANTDIEQYLEIVDILDSSPTKWGSSLGEYSCINPAVADPHIDAVIISSYNSENEIYSSIHDQFGDALILKLYDRKP